jgi:hypothetical protein
LLRGPRAIFLTGETRIESVPLCGNDSQLAQEIGHGNREFLTN